MTEDRPRKRVKWEPPALMVLLMALGVWLVWSSKAELYGLDPDPRARTMELRVGNSRGIVEVLTLPDADPSLRVHLRDGFVSEPMGPARFAELYGPRTLEDALRPRDNALFRLFNITSWASLMWVGIGLVGQGAFFGRMFIQWVLSEKSKASVVPPAFWWFSLVGGVALFVYFVWRQDFVGVLGQSTGIVIYARNIRLIAKQRAREAGGPTGSTGTDGPTSA